MSHTQPISQGQVNKMNHSSPGMTPGRLVSDFPGRKEEINEQRKRKTRSRKKTN